MCPEHEDVVDEAEPEEGLEGLGSQKLLLKLAHEEVCIGWGHSGTHGCTSDL